MTAVLNFLRIKNLALVEELEWELAPGFIAVTGETGAGKSVIIGALQLLLGERADKSLIRTGADSCMVEAVFAGGGSARLYDRLVEAGIEAADSEVIIKRSLSTGGANRQFVNGSPPPPPGVKGIWGEFVDLPGAHDPQLLTS